MIFQILGWLLALVISCGFLWWGGVAGWVMLVWQDFDKLVASIAAIIFTLGCVGIYMCIAYAPFSITIAV